MMLISVVAVAVLLLSVCRCCCGSPKKKVQTINFLARPAFSSQNTPTPSFPDYLNYRFRQFRGLFPSLTTTRNRADFRSARRTIYFREAYQGAAGAVHSPQGRVGNHREVEPPPGGLFRYNISHGTSFIQRCEPVLRSRISRYHYRPRSVRTLCIFVPLR